MALTSLEMNIPVVESKRKTCKEVIINCRLETSLSTVRALLCQCP